MTADDVPPVPRVRPPEDGSERETLAGLLDFLRATVVNKVAGLSHEQASSTPLSPSTLTPAGLVKHLTGVERFWFSIDFAGADLPWPWTESAPHGNFRLGLPRHFRRSFPTTWRSVRGHGGPSKAPSSTIGPEAPS